MSSFFWLMACIHPVMEPVTLVPLSTLPERSLTVQQANADLWRPELRPAWRNPTADETRAITRLVPELLHAAQTGQISSDAAAYATTVGMRLERWEVAGNEHLALTELPDQRRGAGAYLFSVAHPVSSSPWLLWEAPHPYFDLRTGDIAASLYFNPPTADHSPAAFFTSSLHRYTQTDGAREKKPNNPADPCHNPDHLFNVATQAAAATFAQATVVQLHGFSTSDDEGNRPPEDAMLVVSAGLKEGPTVLSAAVANRIATLFPTGVHLFPVDVQSLGATTNVEMLGLQNIPGSRFLHIEMSGALRDLLFQDPSQRDALGAALYTLATTPSP